MTLNLSAAGREWDAGEQSWSSKDAILYALGVGAGSVDPLSELPFTTENSAGIPQEVIPTFPVTLTGTGMPSLGDFSWTNVLHAEQTIELFGRFPVEGTAAIGYTILGFYDKGRDALIEVESVVRDAGSGARLARLVSGIFVRGEGGFGGERGQSKVWAQPQKKPDSVQSTPTRVDQALLYRLSGDRNPLHSDPSFAARAGFERPILHGLCSYGTAARVLLAEVLGGDSSLFGAMTARFASVVVPGDELVTQVWCDDHGASFVVSVEDRPVLTHGRLQFRTAGQTDA